MLYFKRLLLPLCAGLLTLSAQAQDSAANGKLLFDDTSNASSLNNVGSNCAQCHDVQSRRAFIAGTRTNPGSPYANIEFDQAMARFQQAVQGVNGMALFAGLNAQEARDIGAYLSDTPKTSPSAGTTLSFSASALNTPTTAQAVDLTHAVATTASLVIDSVTISGANAARFTLVTDNCNLQTLTPGMSCRLSARYSAADTSLASAQLTLTMHQGASGPFTRVLPLSGSVASTPPPSGGGSSDSGGGALGWRWLAALALAVGLLAATRRSARPRPAALDESGKC